MIVVVRLTMMMMADMDMKVEEAGAALTMTMPIQCRVCAENQRGERNQGHQQQTGPPHAVPESPAQSSQHQLRFYSSLMPESRA